MNLTPSELLTNGYKLDIHLNHSELLPFVRLQLRTKNVFSAFYWLFNVAAFCTFIFFLIQEERLPTIECVLQAFLGVFVFFFVLLPLHEGIHGLFYKLKGATKVTFTAQWDKLVFYVLADKFVVNKKEFFWIALSPFVILNTLLIITMFFVTATWFWTLFGALMLHTGGCFGDFGLVSYFHNNRKQYPCTYDDTESKMSFFFLKQAT
jgi:hypothetical protein